jgi:3-oxoacyl-[acyl-carrier-protein] synthase II
MSPLQRRIVITGMGSISTMGDTADALWNSVKAGKSGIRKLSLITPEEMTCPIGGEYTEFDPERWLDKKEARRMDRFTQFAVIAAREAYESSGLEGQIDKTRLSVIIGSGAGGLSTIQQQLLQCYSKGFHKCSPFLVPMMISDMAAGRVSIDVKAQGPNMAIVTACATGSDCIGQAARMIESGEVDAVIAGGAEAPLMSVSVAGFAAMRALSMRSDAPEKASRPFDKDRDGFVMSEGSGVIVVEDYDHAVARGATIFAELVGYGRSSDAFDIVMPHQEGEGAARAMTLALSNAGIHPSDIGYINAHGTSTPLGDIAETVAVKKVFGEHAKNGLLVSSTKSMHGHMLGATGAIEAIICIKTLEEQLVPPTINLDNPDDACDLDYVPHTARKVNGLQYAMSNSFGFGGHNATLIFKKP